MKVRFRIIAGGLAAVLLMASVATRPVGVASATPMLTGAQINAQVTSILSRACQDCHSDITRYPWYSYVAPVSLLIKEDVQRGRERLNLSQWHEYSSLRRQRALSEIANQVKIGGMPLEIYTRLHPEAKLSDADAEAVFQWTQSERLRLILESRR